MKLEKVLKESFNLSEFRIGQKDIISSVLDGHDALAVLPTGGGKSLCFQFPAVHLNKLVIVISPLIALMKDQVNSLRVRGIPAGCFYSGQTEFEKREIFSLIDRSGSFVLYLSPERVQKDGFQKWIVRRSIALFAIDEAHCVSQWGHDFREEYAELKVLKLLRPDVPVLALTASATPTVLDDIAKNLNLKNPKRLVRGFYRPNLYYQVETCVSDEEKLAWVFQSIKQNPVGRILIYCGTRKVTEQLAYTLRENFEDVSFYHAGLKTQDRTVVQEAYQNGKVRILVATNAFGMGIDQPDVRLVVHFQMPGNIDSLYQEMGRAGRDGLNSTCLMLYSKKDKGLQSYFIQSSYASQMIKNLRWRNLEALVNYSEARECRHAEILTYYKDAQRIKTCGHCDVCDSQSSRKVETPNFENILLPNGADDYEAQAATETQTVIENQTANEIQATIEKAANSAASGPISTGPKIESRPVGETGQIFWFRGGNQSKKPNESKSKPTSNSKSNTNSELAFISKSNTNSKLASNSKSEINLTAVEEDRFQRLRTWRKIKAEELDQPAFCVFSDKTLKEIARRNPTKIDDLRSVYGIGDQKIEKFGWDVLAELHQK